MKINYLKRLLVEILGRFSFRKKANSESEFYNTEIPDIDVFAMVEDKQEGGFTLQDYHPEQEVLHYDIHVFKMKDGQPFTLLDREEIPVADIKPIIKCLERHYQTQAEYI